MNPIRSLARHLAIIVFFFSLPCLAGDEPRVLTGVAEIRALSREEAATGFPVRLHGTVVYRASGGAFFNVHDGTQSATVQLFRAEDRHIWAEKNKRMPASENEPGAVVEIVGVTGFAGYSPVILPIRFKRVGTAPLPPPLRPSMEQLISGSLVSQRLEIEGVIQRAVRFPDGRFELNIMAGGHLCLVSLLETGDLNPNQLVDARVRVRGCSNPGFNLRAEAINIRLLCQGLADLEVLEGPSGDPFNAPGVLLDQLLPFSAKLDRYHRKVTRGIVNFVMPGQFFFIQQGKTGVRVESSSAVVQVGDVAEVAGFVETSRTLASMRDALARTVGHEILPAAEVVTVERIFQPNIADSREPVSDMDYSGHLVRLRGVIQKIEPGKDATPHTFFISSDSEVFSAFLDARAPAFWVEGSEVELTGVCELEFKPGTPRRKLTGISGFNLWLRSPQDIRVLSVPSWWTPRRLGLALGTTGAVLALALIWAWLLRRRVARQMGIISAKLRGEAVNTERNRVARDLHDTLEQQLVGVAIQLDSVGKIIHEDPEGASEAVSLASRMLRHTRLEARRSVWDLRSHVLESQGLVAALEDMAASASGTAGPMVDVRVIGAPRILSLGADFQLLRVAQESIANALKHGHATNIVITLETPADVTRLIIYDDGVGFVPGALEHSGGPHFGVLGMQERAARIGADLSITATPGAGCIVTLTLPVQETTSLHTT